ncbi:MAG: CHAT domain-containing protein [Bryobacterales bacterium]|nr:CHAT domain-containing protein [Bryobacterales bacterium]
MPLSFRVDGNWTVTRQAMPAGKRRGAAAASILPHSFLAAGVTVEAILDASLPAGARRGESGALQLNVGAEGGEGCVVAARHASGALTFHRPLERVSRRRGAVTADQLAFHIPVRAQEARRGILSKAVKVVLLKVAAAAANKAVEIVLPKVALAWEKLAWQRKKLSEGWFQVGWGGGKLQLTPAVPAANRRNLLLIHGTFSDAAGAFGALDANGFLDSVKPLYGDHVYAFNHFTVSRTPEENVRMMLEQLPDGAHSFDVITHSRGGLVLRNLAERRSAFGALASRFSLGKAVLVASPNAGTPLATAERWEKTVGWLANLMEIFPDNPFTTGAEFVSEAIVWLARHGVGNLPGLASMDMAGDSIQELQAPPGPPPGAYYALAANYHPDEALWQRLLDVGVDQFYAGANDLVVPTEGGWRFDHDSPGAIAADRVGCFGSGGNLQADAGFLVHHTNIFQPQQTAAFLQAALEGKPAGLAPLNLAAALPDRRVLRGGAAAAVAPLAAPASVPATLPAGPVAAPEAAAFAARYGAAFDNFHLIILEPDESGTEQAPVARILASYGGARVVEPFVLRRVEGGPQTRWRDIIGLHERIKNYTNQQQGSLPSDPELLKLGVDLFETLFPGNVRRLYDVARSQQGSRRLDVILTSMIAWVADKPWEFAFDPSRRSFLATEEIHFVRNVLTAIPAEPILKVPRPLRILVASAQPLGSAQLSTDQETQLIRRGFDLLIDAGAVQVDVLPQATPAAIHGYLSTGNYNVIHFIGHGDFDDAKQEGCLVFQDERGGEYRLGERNVREIFCQRGVSLVFLNACQTGRGGKADFNKGVAQALVAHGLPALVANQYSVLDTSATSFAQHFYWSLSQGMSIGESAREARIAVNYSMLGETIDWAVPVVYARDPNDRLCPAGAKREMVPAVTGAMTRRGGAKQARRVAIWDVDHDFPALDQTLRKLNAAQDRFAFELVELSSPIDAWHRNDDGTVYFHAKRFSQRMRSRVSAMKVDYMILLTHHWMTDGETLNLLGWWDVDESSPMMALSFAGFEDRIAPSGPATERMLTNSFVAALCGAMTEWSTHEAGSKQCPFYYNGERDFDVVRGPARFDARCRKEMQKQIPADLPAFEKLMTLFDDELKGLVR